MRSELIASGLIAMDKLITTPAGLVTIRPVAARDAILLWELRLEGLAKHPEAFGADYESAAAEAADFWAQRIENYARENTGVIYVAAVENQLVGLTGIVVSSRPKLRHNANIWGVYVRAEWRGFHIAEALIEACIAWAKAQGAVVVKLGVATNNPSAIRCYVRCGFSVYGVDPKAIYYNGVFIDELLMVREL